MRHAVPVPTLRQIHVAPYWVWLHCPRCLHKAPMGLAAAIIRWGPDASSDVLRRRARCSRCGHLGATLQTPSWGDISIGWAPFPADMVIAKFD